MTTIATLADPLGVTLAACAIATLLGHAAAVKLEDRGLFAQHLAAYGVPSGLSGPGVWALPLLEALLAFGLLSPWRSVAGGVTACLLAAYGAAMAWHLVRGHRLDCGCGGAPMVVSWWLVARNGGLAAVALVAAMPMAVDRGLGWGDVAAIAASLVLLALLYAGLHEVLRIGLRARGEDLQGAKPGTGLSR